MPAALAYRRRAPGLSADCAAWEHQPGEPGRLFAAFTVYRELGPARTLRETAAACRARAPTVREWAREWLWEQRVVAWDRDQAAKQAQAAEKERGEVAKRHARIAAQYLNVMAAPVVELGRRLNAGTPMAQVSDADLWKLVRANAGIVRDLVDTERLSHRMPTEHTAVSGPDGGPVQVVTVVDAVRALFSGEAPPAPQVVGHGSGVVDGELADPGSADTGGDGAAPALPQVPAPDDGT